MDMDLTTLERWLRNLSQQMASLAIWVRDRISTETMVFAVVAAGGALIAFIGLTSYRRVLLIGEMAMLEGVQHLSLLERLQIKLYQSGLRIRVAEFLAVGFLIGGVIGGMFILLGFVSLGLLFIGAGPVIYYQHLMSRRIKEVQRFRDELPMAILDTRDHLQAKNDLHGVLTEMAYSGPETVRLYFEQAVSLVTATNNLSQALREVARSRQEPFFRQFFDCLANHHKGGATTAEVLTRIARGQKTQTRLQSKTRARQSGIRVVGAAYMVAPGAMALFMRFFGGEITASFYATPLGQVVQILAALTGVFSYWLGNRIARRGLYVDEVSAARIDTAKVAALIADDEFGEGEHEAIADADGDEYAPPPTTPINMQPIAVAENSPAAAAVAIADAVEDSELGDDTEPDSGDTQEIVWPVIANAAGPVKLDDYVWGKFLQQDNDDLDDAFEDEAEQAYKDVDQPIETDEPAAARDDDEDVVSF
jgi:Flp pilus assembly protein TadB